MSCSCFLGITPSINSCQDSNHSFFRANPQRQKKKKSTHTIRMQVSSTRGLAVRVGADMKILIIACRRIFSRLWQRARKPTSPGSETKTGGRKRLVHDRYSEGGTRHDGWGYWDHDTGTVSETIRPPPDADLDTPESKDLRSIGFTVFWGWRMCTSTRSRSFDGAIVLLLLFLLYLEVPSIPQTRKEINNENSHDQQLCHSTPLPQYEDTHSALAFQHFSTSPTILQFKFAF